MVESVNTLTKHRLGPIFTHAEAISAGMTRADLHHLTPIMHGHYSTCQPVPLQLRVEAVLQTAGKDAIICGSTALRLHGVDLPGRLVRDTRVWLQVPQRQTWPRRAEVRLVRTDYVGHPRIRSGLPLADVPSCWLQLAYESTIDELIEVADAMMRRKHPFTTKAALGRVLESRKGAPGVAKARTALGLSCEGTDSIPETDLRLLLVRGGLPTPIVNLAITDEWGEIIYILDMAYEKAKLAIEYDGAYHVGNRQQMYQDAARRRALEDQGWRVITITSADMLTDPDGIVASVRKALLR